MQTEYPLTEFPSDGKPAVHAYFDLCPEDPTGEKIVYFQFDGPPPRGGQVMVARRDGTGAKLAGRRTATASAHGGARQQWSDAHTVAYNIQVGDRRVYELADIRDGSIERLDNSIRMFCPETGKLHLVDMVSGEHQVVARFATPDTRGGTGCHAHPVWSRDGKRIYFSNNETGQTRFYALDLQAPTRSDILRPYVNSKQIPVQASL